MTRLVAALILAASPSIAIAEPPVQAQLETIIYDTTSVGELAIDAASKAAAESGRRLLVNFGTNDCGPCHVFSEALYEEPFASAFHNQFVPVFVDVSPESKNEALLKRYGVNPSKGLPAVVLSDEQLRVAETVGNGEMAAVAAKGKGAVRQWLLKRFRKDEDLKQ